MPSGGDTAELLARGVERFLAGESREAAEIFHSVLALDPSNVQARHYLQDLLGLGSVAPGVPSLAPNARIATAWDEGPSLQPAIEMSQGNVPAEDASGWESTPGDPVHVHLHERMPRDRADNAERLLAEAREAAARGDFTTAVDRCGRLLEIDPESKAGLELQQEATDTLVKMYESELGGPDGVPVVVADQRELIWLGLDPRSGFVLSQINGQVTYDELHSLCGLSRLETMRILAQLLSQKAIRTLADRA